MLMCVVGPGFDTTAPAFVRSRASQASGTNSRHAPKNGIGTPFLGHCAMSNPVHAVSFLTSEIGCKTLALRVQASKNIWNMFINETK